MTITNILKVKFLKSDETITGPNITEIDIELDDLIKLISDIENIRGLGKSLHKEAYTGIDYLGNEVVFSSYVVWRNLVIFTNIILMKSGYLSIVLLLNRKEMKL